jgi:Predicted acyltransferase
LCLTNDLGRSRDESLGGSALVGLAGTRYTGFAAIARVDRDAHRALGGKAAVISDHIYFVITACAARRTSYEYLKANARLPAHWWHVFRHFHCFAATILDRLYLLRGEFQRFDLKLHGNEILHCRMDSGKGCILLGSHLGSFEVLRALGVMQRNFPLKVLMDPTHNQNITGFFDALNP